MKFMLLDDVLETCRRKFETVENSNVSLHFQ